MTTLTTPVPPAPSVPEPGTDVRRARRTRSPLPVDVVLPALVLAGLAVAALLPALLTSSGPLDTDPASAFQAPSAAHWFGTDESGRDVFARVVHGARDSLSIGLAATGVGLVLALALGLLAGLGPRWADFAVSRTLEVLFAFPNLLIALVVITVVGKGTATLVLAVGLSTAPGYARMIRSQVLTIRTAGYVEAAVVDGTPPAAVITRHVLPNVVRPLFVLATLGVGQAIVWASALSFLGLGATPPDPEWGAMLAAGRAYLTNAWWLTVFPGLAIVLAGVASTVLGHAIQRRGRSGR